jgi:hypothetical protein
MYVSEKRNRQPKIKPPVPFLVMVNLSFLVSVLFIILFTSCSALKIYTDYDTQIEFAKYTTFKIMKHQKQKESLSWVKNTLNLRRMEKAIENHLKTNGYVHLEEGNADFLVAYHIAEKDIVDVTHFGYNYRFRSYPAITGREFRKYKEGTLIIDIVDNKLKELVWRGWIERALRNPELAEDQINKAVSAILAEFPPKKNGTP